MTNKQEYVLPPKVADAIKVVNKIVGNRFSVSKYCFAKQVPTAYFGDPKPNDQFPHIDHLQRDPGEKYKRNIPGTLEYAITPNPEGQDELLYKRMLELRDSLDKALQDVHDALESYNLYGMSTRLGDATRGCMGFKRKKSWKEKQEPDFKSVGTNSHAFTLCFWKTRAHGLKHISSGTCCRPLLCGASKFHKQLEFAATIYFGAVELIAEEEARLERHGVAGA